MISLRARILYYWAVSEMNPTLLLLETVFLGLLIGFSAFFSGSETAFFSLSRVTVEKLKHRRSDRGALIARLLSHPRRLLVSIVIGNMLVNILSSAVGERLSSQLIPESLQSLAWVFSSVIMTMIILILGEIVPKTMALGHAEGVSLRVAPSLLILQNLVAPIRKLVRLVSDQLVALLWRDRVVGDSPLTKEELATAIAVGSREGTLDGEEREMINEIFELGNKTVRQLMTPRNEVVSFELQTPIEKIAEAVRAREFSRIPVYSGREDEIVGILYPKDLVVALSRGERIGPLETYLRRAFFVPETMKASRLLKQFLQKKIHVALAVNEYGVFSGLITLDDLVEEIVGEIRDKGESAPDYQVVDEDTVRLRGRTELDFVNEELGLGLASRESVTLGGYLFEKIGRIPEPGDVFEDKDLKIEVLTLKGNRVGQVLIRRRGLGRRVRGEGE